MGEVYRKLLFVAVSSPGSRTQIKPMLRQGNDLQKGNFAVQSQI
jgi:hypothetical protein